MKHRMTVLLFCTALVTAFSGHAIAADLLKVGDTAPDFSLPGSDGQLHRLSDYRGQTVVLAWFPKAFTGG